MKTFLLGILFLICQSVATAGLKEELDAVMQTSSKEVSKYNAVLFGRLPQEHHMRWVLVQFQGDYFERLMKIIRSETSEVPHHDGPFGSEVSVVLRVYSSSKKVFSLRLWNNTISLDVEGKLARSFEFEREEVAAEIRKLVNEMLKKNGTEGVFAFESAEGTRDLLHILGISDHQMGEFNN